MYADKVNHVHTSANIYRVMLSSAHTFYDLLVGSAERAYTKALKVYNVHIPKDT